MAVCQLGFGLVSLLHLGQMSDLKLHRFSWKCTLYLRYSACTRFGPKVTPCRNKNGRKIDFGPCRLGHELQIHQFGKLHLGFFWWQASTIDKFSNSGAKLGSSFEIDKLLGQRFFIFWNSLEDARFYIKFLQGFSKIWSKHFIIWCFALFRQIWPKIFLFQPMSSFLGKHFLKIY